MSLKNTYNSYGSVAKWLHWLTFFFILGLLIAGFSMDFLPKGPTKGMVANAHKATGIFVFFLIIFRFIWKMINLSPEMPKGLSLVEKLLAIMGHYILYLLIFLMPLSGWIMSTTAGRLPHIGSWNFPGFPFVVEGNKSLGSLAHTIHVNCVWVLIAFITIHILAALRHHLILRDNVMRRMFPYGNALE